MGKTRRPVWTRVINYQQEVNLTCTWTLFRGWSIVVMQQIHQHRTTRWQQWLIPDNFFLKFLQHRYHQLLWRFRHILSVIVLRLLGMERSFKSEFYKMHIPASHKCCNWIFLQVQFSIVTWDNAWGLFRLKHTNHLVKVQITLCFGIQYVCWSPQTWLERSGFVTTNTSGRSPEVSLKVSSVVSNCCHWLGTPLSINSTNISPASRRDCQVINM